MGDALQHLSYALLVAAMLGPRGVPLRLFVAGASAAGLAHAWFWSDDLIAASWMGALLIASTGAVLASLWKARQVPFTPEEERMRQVLLPGVPKPKVRHMLDRGYWLTGEEGDVLTREGEPVAQLYYIGEGSARALSGGRVIGQLTTGDLVGELTVLSGEPATATVVLTERTRFWCAHAEELRPYVEAHEDILHALEHGFALALSAKLRASNRALAEAGGMAPA